MGKDKRRSKKERGNSSQDMTKHDEPASQMRQRTIIPGTNEEIAITRKQQSKQENDRTSKGNQMTLSKPLLATTKNYIR